MGKLFGNPFQALFVHRLFGDSKKRIGVLAAAFVGEGGVVVAEDGVAKLFEQSRFADAVVTDDVQNFAVFLLMDGLEVSQQLIQKLAVDGASAKTERDDTLFFA